MCVCRDVTGWGWECKEVEEERWKGISGGQVFVLFLLLGFSVWFESVAAFVVVSYGYRQLENATATVGT